MPMAIIGLEISALDLYEIKVYSIGQTMEYLKEKFLKVFANVPINLRDDTILLIDNKGVKQPITWSVAYLEVKSDTELGQRILEGLKKLELI